MSFEEIEKRDGQWYGIDENGDDTPIDINAVNASELSSDSLLSDHNVSGATLDMRRFGADETGTNGSDTAFTDAIDRANPGDTVLFRDGTFVLNESHTIEKPLIIKGNNAEIERHSEAGAAGIRFEGGGRTGTTASLTDTVARGSTKLPVSDSTLFGVGDRVMVREETFDQATTQDFQFAAIVDINSTDDVLSISNGVAHPFDTNAEVDVIDLIDGARIEDLDFYAPESENASSVMWMEWCERPIMDNVQVTGTKLYAHKMYNCWQPIQRDCVAINSHTNDSGQREPISQARCCDGVIDSCRAYDHRRGIDLTIGTHSTTIINPVIERCRTGVADHTPGGGIDNSIIGGRISQHPDLGSSSCIGINSDNFRVDGTVLKVSEKAISIRDSDNVQISDVLVDVVDGADSSSNGMTIRGDCSNISIDNLQWEDPSAVLTGGGSFGTILIDPSTTLRNLDIDIHANVGDLSALFRVHSNAADIVNMAVSGRIEGESTTNILTLDGPRIDNFKWTADVYGAVRVRFDCESNSIRFEGCDIEADDNALEFGEMTSVDRLRVTDCYLSANTGADLLLEGDIGSISEMWLTNNRIETYTEDTTPGSMVQSGNIPLDIT